MQTAADLSGQPMREGFDRSQSVGQGTQPGQAGRLRRRVDFNDPASVEAAARGVDRVLLVSSGDFQDRLTPQKVAITALISAGVKNILYTSLHNVENTSWVAEANHLDTEAFLRESKVPGYTFLRNGLYFDNDIGTIAGAKFTGTWPSAAKDGKLAGISRDDLALENAMALVSDDNENQIYELSGSKGKSIKVVHLTADQLVEGIVAAAGVPLALAQAIAGLQTATANGVTGPTAEDFKKLTGREPTPHAQWVETMKATLVVL